MDFNAAERGVTIPLSLSKLLGPAETAIAARHQGLVCEPELVVWFGPNGDFRRVNPYQGSCHDAGE